MDSADRGQSRNCPADLTGAPLPADATPHRQLADQGHTRHYAPMPFNVELRDEHGAVMAQIVGVPGPWTLPSVVDNDRNMIRFIDPYGDTIFNHLQAAELCTELISLLSVLPAKECTVIESIAELAQRCTNEVHTYLWFIGD
jgi:hypothetical protein